MPRGAAADAFKRRPSAARAEITTWARAERAAAGIVSHRNGAVASALLVHLRVHRNGAVASALLVHLRVESAHFDWR
jgi:hypothetical protein